MKKRFTPGKTVRLTAVVYLLIVAGTLVIVNACNKGRNGTTPLQTDVAAQQSTAKAAPAVQGLDITSVLTVANMRPSTDGSITRVMFNENEQIFNIQDPVIIAALKDAFAGNTPVSVTFNPWKADITRVEKPSTQEIAAATSREVVRGEGTAKKVNLASMTEDVINNPVTPAGISPINTSSTGLTNVIPNFETAQMMFDYIAHQCCALPGPYGVDHCISFQYCEDGCYARAHKMCWIINNKYHYGTKKIFSFANAGHDELCVQGQKWGGCCINWWYHVAPLVTIQTTTGPKAYVFDPAMFDQPVLLSTWLHAQENPACVPGGDVPHVSMINVQPTASYSPSGTSGMSFNTDPSYYNTNSTLTSYAHLSTCP